MLPLQHKPFSDDMLHNNIWFYVTMILSPERDFQHAELLQSSGPFERLF